MKSVYILLLLAAIFSFLTSKPLNFSAAVMSTVTRLSNTQAKVLGASPWKSYDQVLIGYEK